MGALLALDERAFADPVMTENSWNPSPTPIVSIPDDFLRAIGKVNVCWGGLESIMDLALSKIGGFGSGDSRGAIMTAHMPLPQKLDVLSAIAVSLVPDYPHMTGFESVKPLLKKAQESRNKVAHGTWSLDNGAVYKGRLTARGKLKISIEPVTIADLEAVCLDIHKAGLAVIELILKK